MQAWMPSRSFAPAMPRRRGIGRTVWALDCGAAPACCAERLRDGAEDSWSLLCAACMQSPIAARGRGGAAPVVLSGPVSLDVAADGARLPRVRGTSRGCPASLLDAWPAVSLGRRGSGRWLTWFVRFFARGRCGAGRAGAPVASPPAFFRSAMMLLDSDLAPAAQGVSDSTPAGCGGGMFSWAFSGLLRWWGGRFRRFPAKSSFGLLPFFDEKRRREA